MIDHMVNHSVFAGFQTREHALLFVVLRRDFLSEVRAVRNAPLPRALRKPVPSDRTFIFTPGSAAPPRV